MSFDVKESILKMLSMDFLKKDSLLHQLDEITYKIDKQQMKYVITFDKTNVSDVYLHGDIRMDTYQGLHEMFAFELAITNGRFQSLTISKHNDDEALDFTLEDVVFEKLLLSYDIQFFANLKYLPIGTIVSLQKGIKKLMIYGRSVKEEAEDKLYEYVGCLYPEGIRDFNRVYVFESSQITKVHWLGLCGVEEEKMLSMIA